MRHFAALLALALTLAPASVFACAMEFEIPEEIEAQPNDDALLVALMEEIDSALETNDDVKAESKEQANSEKQQDTPTEPVAQATSS